MLNLDQVMSEAKRMSRLKTFRTPIWVILRRTAPSNGNEFLSYVFQESIKPTDITLGSWTNGQWSNG